MQTENLAPLKGRPLLAFRGAVFFLLIDLCFDMVEVGGSKPPGPYKIKTPAHAGALIARDHPPRSVTRSSCR